MQKLSIQMLKDNGRTVIILEGSSRERDEMAYKIVSAYLAPEENQGKNEEFASVQSNAVENTPPKKELDNVVPLKTAFQTKNALEKPSEIPEVRGLKPIKHKDEPFEISDKAESYQAYRRRGTQIISIGRFKGLTPVEALTQYNEVALVELFHVASNLSECEERAEIIRSCKQYMYNLPELAGEKYQTRDDMVKFIRCVAEMVAIDVFINGYANLDSFCNGAGDSEIEAVFTNIIWSLAERGNRVAV